MPASQNCTTGHPLARAPLAVMAGRFWHQAHPLFLSNAPAQGLILNYSSRKLRICVCGLVFFPLPFQTAHAHISWSAVFGSADVKGGPWGQAVQVFHFSHRCTHRQTEFSIIHRVQGKNLPSHFAFNTAYFSCSNAEEKKSSFPAAKGCCRPRFCCRLGTNMLPSNVVFFKMGNVRGESKL